MYVLVDMEWISNQRGNHWPTQLAATRVDAQWNTVDIFSALFRPKGFSFQQWGHMAFSGWNREQFLNGESLYAGLDAFRLWLQPEDTICWWHQEASDLFNMFSKVSGVPDMTQHVVLLCNYIYGYLAGQEASVGSPYKICAARNIVTPSPAHCSVNDVATMQLLAQVIGFEQKYLLEPPKRWSKDAIAQKGSSAYKLLYDPQAKLLHQSDCELLPDDRHFPAFLTFKLPIRRKYKPCSCCRDEFLDALWDRNQDSIARSEYNYVYSKQSKIFHTRKCSHVLLAYDIQGSVSYDTCLKSGRRPCKHCNPEPIEHKTIAFPVLPKKPQAPQERSLSKDEQSAIGRFNRAKQEREAAFKRGSLSDAEKSNIMALSQPGLAFWASMGYRTFHRRNCPQITGLNQLVGFPRYQDAVRAGYCPCRHCKPSPKQDVVYSIPITNKKRAGESVETLVQLCTEHCLPFHHDNRYFEMQTMVGKWKIDMDMRPVRLEHINLVSQAENTKKYHVQPRLFLSLKDTFDYIMRHDNTLMKRIEGTSQEVQLQMG